MKVAKIELHNGYLLSVSDGQLPLTIGRGRQCDLRLTESTVSRRHCQLYMEDGQTLRLKDISANGTTVNRRSLRGGSIPIHERSEVQFSDHFAITVTPTDDNGVTLVP